MNIYEAIGVGWVILGAVCFTAAAMFCAGLGVWVIYRDWHAGSEQEKLERIARS